MTDADVIVAILKIIHTKPRVKAVDKGSAEARDLARYDLIAGLVRRHAQTRAPATLGDAVARERL